MTGQPISYLLPSHDAKEMLGLWAEPFEVFRRLDGTFRLDA